MGTELKKDRRKTHLTSSEHSGGGGETESTQQSSVSKVWAIAIAVGFGVVGWSLCGAVIGVGSQFVPHVIPSEVVTAIKPDH